MRSDFRLTKWYLDGATPAGDAVVVYWAELRWHQLSAHYAATLVLEGGRLRERASLLSGAPPTVDGDTVSFECPDLDFAGRWQGRIATAGPRTLLEREGRTLVWECLQPLASAALSHEGHVLRASGYTERLTLAVPPWELPIEELRWGRAHGGGHSVVWVDWSGNPACHLVLADGAVREGASASRTEVTAAGVHLSLGPPRPVREGPVIGSILGRVPGLSPLLSSAGLLIDEHKWLAPVTLELDGRTHEGTALHEVVRWR